jgi:hypothetical protein
MPRLEDVPMHGDRPFAPRISSFTRPFWDALADGRLTTTRCAACGAIGFPPRPVCRACWGRAMRWETLAPHGTLYSFTRVHVVPGAFAADAPYAIGIVDLQSGPRLMCRLVGPVGPDALDGPVGMVVLRYRDGPLFGARPVVPGRLPDEAARSHADGAHLGPATPTVAARRRIRTP